MITRRRASVESEMPLPVQAPCAEHSSVQTHDGRRRREPVQGEQKTSRSQAPPMQGSENARTDVTI